MYNTARMKYKPAFTIVELLIVIVVIAILAAISIVAYTGIQDKARETAALSLVSQTAKKLTAYQATDTNGLYPDSLTATDLNLTDTDRAKLQYSVNNTTTPPTFCITATEGTLSYYQNTTTQTTPAKGGCNGHGQGGVAAITNLVANPSFENGVTGYAVTSAAGGIVSSDWSASGSNSLRLTPAGSGNDSYFTIGGDLGGFRAGLEAGKTYTISATTRLTAPLSGSFSGNGSRQITAWYTSSSGSHVRTTGSQAPNASGQTRVSVTYTVPATATAAWLRFYHGGSAGSGSVWWDDIMITEGSTVHNYADGNSQGWAWSGGVNNSTSTGPPR